MTCFMSTEGVCGTKLIADETNTETDIRLTPAISLSSPSSAKWETDDHYSASSGSLIYIYIMGFLHLSPSFSEVHCTFTYLNCYLPPSRLLPSLG
jgi:hypothetical protein